MLGQFAVQLLGSIATLLWSALTSFVIVNGVEAAVGLRVSDEDEEKGLDLIAHGESGYKSESRGARFGRLKSTIRAGAPRPRRLTVGAVGPM
jgi:ammonia channel protein AmtB